jgi:hypothetical protein
MKAAIFDSGEPGPPERKEGVMPRTTTTFADFVKEGDRIVGAVRANAASLPHLQLPVDKLASMVESIGELLIQQGMLQASKQQVSSELRLTLEDGLRLLTFLRKGIREQYGPRNEKLVEFGLQPFRSRIRRPEPVTPPVPVVEDSQPSE